jgi:hypothetical protein
VDIIKKSEIRSGIIHIKNEQIKRIDQMEVKNINEIILKQNVYIKNNKVYLIIQIFILYIIIFMIHKICYKNNYIKIKCI